MPAKITIQRSKIKELSKQGRALAANRNKELAELTADLAKQFCPVGEERGQVHLRDTICVEVNKRTGGASVIAGDESRGVNHAQLVEFGFHHKDGSYVEGKPFMRPAADLAIKRIKNRKI